MMAMTALAMIQQAVSPMPIGRTSGCLSIAMRQRAKSGAIDEGCTCIVQTLMQVLHRDPLMHPCDWYRDTSTHGSPDQKTQQHHSHSRRLSGWHWHLGIQISQGKNPEVRLGFSLFNGRVENLHGRTRLDSLQRRSVAILYVIVFLGGIRHVLSLVGVVFSPHSLRQETDSVPTLCKANVVCWIPCTSCSSVYVGQVGRTHLKEQSVCLCVCLSVCLSVPLSLSVTPSLHLFLKCTLIFSVI